MRKWQTLLDGFALLMAKDRQLVLESVLLPIQSHAHGGSKSL